jgi:hypothetical protein
MWETAVWSQLEPTLGITCACIPLMRPVLDRFILRRKETTARSGHKTSYHQRSVPADTFELTDTSFWVHNSMESEEDYKESGVRVKRDWEVLHERGGSVSTVAGMI